MSDPSIEAAQRAEAAGWIHRQHAEAGAREALKPIRELHRPMATFLWANASCRNDHDVTNDTSTGDDVCLTCTAADGGPVKVCADCFAEDGSHIDWPCETAKLIYTSEELDTETPK